MEYFRSTTGDKEGGEYGVGWKISVEFIFWSGTGLDLEVVFEKLGGEGSKYGEWGVTCNPLISPGYE